jgi:electron transfer flavoprotein alpha/beta subunit
VGVFATDDDDTICQEALDLGFDAAVSITAPVPIDFFGEALLLRAAIDSMRSTMVICGDYDGNFEGASMGAALAFMLDIPCMTGVLDCKFKGDDYLIKRRTDIGVDHIRCPRPALLTFMDRNKDAVPIDSKKKASAAVESRPASTLLEDLSVLYSRSPLAVHAAFAARPEATELVSDPKALLTCLREANLWDSK